MAPGEHHLEGTLLHRVRILGTDRAAVIEIAIVVLGGREPRSGEQGEEQEFVHS